MRGRRDVEPMTDTRATPAQNRARIALATAFVVAALWIGHTFVPALLWACVIATGIDPLTRQLDRRLPGRRGVTALILVTAVALVVMIPLTVAATRAAVEVRGLAAWYGHARASGIAVPQWVASLPIGSDQLRSWWEAHLATGAGASRELSRIDTAMLMQRSRGIGHSLLERVVVFAFTLTILFFLVRDREHVAGQMRRGATRAFGASGPRLGRQVLASVRGTVDGLVMLGIAQAVVMSIIYAVAGVPHPVLVGALSGLASVIPFGLAFVMVLALLTVVAKGAIVTAIVAGAVGFAINFTTDHFIRPGIIGGATRLPFVWVLIGIVGGVETIGLLGLFVGPAVMAALVMMWREWVDERHAGDPGDPDQDAGPRAGGLFRLPGRDEFVRIETLPDEQPHASRGVFRVIDQEGEHRAIRRDGSIWTAIKEDL